MIFSVLGRQSKAGWLGCRKPATRKEEKTTKLAS